MTGEFDYTTKLRTGIILICIVGLILFSFGFLFGVIIGLVFG